MQENQQKSQQRADDTSASGSTSAAVADQDIKAAEEFDEMSVEELNALQPSERRRNMMEALERRKAKAAQ
jgi:hypothetical protein